MNLTLAQKHLLAGVIALTLTILFALSYMGSQKASASAPPGLPATIATSTNPSISTSAIVLIATSSCSARIVQTNGTTVMLTFDDKFTPTGTFGVFQAASTTAVYDSGQYGCGQVKGIANTAGTVTVIDSR